MKYNEIEAFKNLVGNKIFTVEFIKKNGESRIMNARLGVKKYLKGGEIAYNPIDRGYLPVYDMQKKDYRMININSIQRLKFEGIEYEVN